MVFARTTLGIGSLSLSVTACTANGVSPIVLTCSTMPTSVEVGQRILVAGVASNNGAKTITAVDYALKKITYAGTGSGTYGGSGGTVAREYATPDLWQAATVANLTSGGGSPQNEIRTGECYADADFTWPLGSSLTIAGCTVDANHYRILTAWPTHRWDPRKRTGVRFVATVDVGHPCAVIINEQYAQMRYIGVELADAGVTTGGPYIGVKVTADNVFVDGVSSKVPVGDSSSLTWDCFSHTSGGNTLATRSTFTNCVAIGGGTYQVGATNGFRSTRDFDRFYNCVAYRCRGGTSHGFSTSGTGVEVRNCIAMENSDVGVVGSADFVCTGTFDHCISSDSTATGPASQSGQFAANVFVYAPYDDFRVLQSSAATDSGVDLSTTTIYVDNPNVNVKMTTDMLGSTRTVPWEIGCFNGFGARPTAAPTEIISSVGATGRDYATFALWKAATALHLVYLNVRHIAEAYDDADFAIATDLDFSGAVTDSRCYREIRPAALNRYDPVKNTGVAIVGTGTVNTVNLAEDFFRFGGVRVENLTTGTSDRSCVKVTGDNVLVDGVLGYLPGGTAGSRRCFWGAGETTRVRNCIAVGATNTDGADVGFEVNGNYSKVQNCAAIKIRRGASGTAFECGGWPVRFQNCIAGICDIGFNVIDGYQDHNASMDTTAAGVGSIVSIVDDDVWVDWSNIDLRLAAGSVCINAGAKLATEFSSDIEGATRGASWEMGPYDGYLVPAEFPAQAFGVTNRLCTCWTIERLDGVALNFTDDSTPLIHKGIQFAPAGGFDTSARRKEVSLKENNLEARGLISSGAITFDDLRAGRYKGAQVYEYLIDPKYPFMAPRETNVYTLREVNYDGEQWNGQLAGVASKLGTPTGDVYARACNARLGDARCGFDLLQATLLDSVVGDASVSPRLEFNAAALSHSPYADNYFRLGIVTWKTGANAGLTSEIREYTDATLTVKLFLELPFDIQVGDVFDISPGCDLSISTCISKFANVANFRGYPYIPGTDKALQSPSQ